MVDPKLEEIHKKILSLPKDQQMLAAARASVSYSDPNFAVKSQGCIRDGNDLAWPDGERWPIRINK